MVERNLAKVEVASSNLVARSIFPKVSGGFRVTACVLAFPAGEARWQSGYAADCNSVYAGSIPTLASIFLVMPGWRNW